MPTKIQWAHEVWNPTTGCDPVSTGCRNCYAKRMAKRLAGRCGYPAAPYQFNVTLHPDRLELPLHWKKPRRIFVDSMSDLFHEDVPDSFISEVFFTMHLAYWHTFQILTKRPERMQEWVGEVYQPNRQAVMPNVWLGVSVENQATADERIPWLLNTPAAIKFVSCEPLLGPVNLLQWIDICPLDRERPNPLNPHWRMAGDRWQHYHGYPLGHEDTIKESAIDWVIAGGETGPGARPMHPAWARSLRDQCRTAGTPFFFKQQGEFIEAGTGATNNGDYLTTSTIMQRVGKKVAGRLLDGREWNEFPGEHCEH